MSNFSEHKNNTLLDSQPDDYSLSAEEVSEYLLTNPDFFTKHPEVTEKLVIPHTQKGSVSLVEIQGELLRKKTRQLNYKLNQLVTIAKQNEKFTACILT
ncbi:hypothetical protein KUL49_24750 [Alteromonas sp. KUL49]|nr:hypothetical protein KUL49_24750 [Alteromonas sp. KUL49]